jgi:hypothetical protein
MTYHIYSKLNYKWQTVGNYMVFREPFFYELWVNVRIN